MENGKNISNVIDDLLKIILPWDFFTDIVDDRDAASDESNDSKLVSVPSRFESVNHYLEVYESLFFCETKAAIYRAKSLELSTSPEKDQVIQMQLRGDFVRVTMQRERNSPLQISSHDLILLSQHSDLTRANNVHILGFVEQSSSDEIQLRLYMPDENTPPPASSTVPNASLSLQNHRARMVNIANLLQKLNSISWFVCPIINLTTIEREYEALHSIHNMPLRDMLLYGEDAMSAEKKGDAGEGPVVPFSPLYLSPKLHQKLKTLHNPSQLEAILSTLDSKPITLIQGPPGTGKTSTITSIVSALLASTTHASHWEQEAIQQEALQSKKQKRWYDSDSEPETTPTPSVPPQTYRHCQKWFFSPSYHNTYDVHSLSTTSPSPVSLTSSVAPITLQQASAHLIPHKILLTAPSNSAVDEMMRRILQKGLHDKNGNPFFPSIVRIGSNVHPSLTEYSLETMVQKKIAQRHETQEKETLKHQILLKASVICSTLSSCALRDLLLINSNHYNTVIVDEASQGIELATLIPLKLGCRRLVLVGDHRQLPATVFSSLSVKYQYDRSLFQRLLSLSYPCKMLKIQYRMHPEISRFSSMCFYDEELKDAEEIMKIIPKSPWWDIPLFRPTVFFNLEGREFRRESGSLVNMDECGFICRLVELFVLLFKSHFDKEDMDDEDRGKEIFNRIGIISPYGDQVGLIRRELKKILDIPISQNCPIDVNTVDGFQGREKDLVILSCVRSEKRIEVRDGEEKERGNESLGFVTDQRRLNVAITRSKCNLFVVGNANHLVKNEIWEKFIVQHEKNGRYFSVSNPMDTFLIRYFKKWMMENSGAFNFKDLASVDINHHYQIAQDDVQK